MVSPPSVQRYPDANLVSSVARLLFDETMSDGINSLCLRQRFSAFSLVQASLYETIADGIPSRERRLLMRFYITSLANPSNNETIADGTTIQEAETLAAFSHYLFRAREIIES